MPQTTKRKYTYRTLHPVDGRKLRELIYDNGYGINEFCRKAGIYKFTLYHMLQGKYSRVKTIKKVARVLGVHWEELVKEV